MITLLILNETGRINYSYKIYQTNRWQNINWFCTSILQLHNTMERCRLQNSSITLCNTVIKNVILDKLLLCFIEVFVHSNASKISYEQLFWSNTYVYKLKRNNQEFTLLSRCQTSWLEMVLTNESSDTS